MCILLFLFEVQNQFYVIVLFNVITTKNTNAQETKKEEKILFYSEN
jgi:hypothetical protein